MEAVRASGFDLAELDYVLNHRFSLAAAFVPTDANLAQTLTEIRTGVLAVDAPTAAEKLEKQQSVVIDRASVALGLSGDLTGSLLGQVVHTGETAFRRLLETAATDIAEPLSRTTAAAAFETLEQLLKVGSVIQTLALPVSSSIGSCAKIRGLASLPTRRRTRRCLRTGSP